MILACHQPQYLAWLGYYHKMGHCDAWVYLDRVQFKKREFQNRNRVKGPEGEVFLSVPVLTKGRRDQTVGEVETDQTQRWQQQHLRSLKLYYRKALHFAEHEQFLEHLYARPWPRLMPLCLEWDSYLRSQLGVSARIILESEAGSEGLATQRILSLCRRLGADTYLSGRGGKAYLDEPAFERAGIRLAYQEFAPPEYPQRFGAFVPNLAAVDLLFNCGAEVSRGLLAGAGGG